MQYERNFKIYFFCLLWCWGIAFCFRIIKSVAETIHPDFYLAPLWRGKPPPFSGKSPNHCSCNAYPPTVHPSLLVLFACCRNIGVYFKPIGARVCPWEFSFCRKRTCSTLHFKFSHLMLWLITLVHYKSQHAFKLSAVMLNLSRFSPSYYYEKDAFVKILIIHFIIRKKVAFVTYLECNTVNPSDSYCIFIDTINIKHFVTPIP